MSDSRNRATSHCAFAKYDVRCEGTAQKPTALTVGGALGFIMKVNDTHGVVYRSKTVVRKFY